jgi:uncharacterized protein YlxW (UPF0749 family)
MIKLITIIVALSFSFAIAQDSMVYGDGIPEPDGDLQYIIFAVFVFLSFLAWLGYKVWATIIKVPTQEEATKDLVSHIDTQLQAEIAENARQIAILEGNVESEKKRFDEFKTRQEEQTNKLFDKIDKLDEKMGAKIDNLVAAIIKEKTNV